MSTTVQTLITIHGMTCMSCKNLIEKTLAKTAGISTVAVDYPGQKANVTFDSDIITREEIMRVIDDLGYEAQDYTDDSLSTFFKTTVSVAVIAVLFILIQRFDLLNYLVPSQLAESGMGYGMLFVIGLITSVHCIAMCGGINLSQSITPEQKASNFSLKTFQSSFLYNAGRVVSYTVIGALLGLVGSFFSATGGISSLFQGLLKIVAGVAMVGMGANMLGLISLPSNFRLPLPRAVTRLIGSTNHSAKKPFIIGLLNGLMPCGPLQSMQIIALASGNPLVGGLSMLFFSLGTTPLMLGFGSLVSALGARFKKTVASVGAVLVVVLGLALFLQGTSMANVLQTHTIVSLILFASIIPIVAHMPLKSALFKVTAIGVVCLLGIYSATLSLSPREQSIAADLSQIKIVNGKQEVRSTLESGAYPHITVKKGDPVRWLIDAPEGSINGCNNALSIPDYGITYEFKPGENVIEFTPTKTGTSRVTCWMGMIEGSITVVE